MAGGCLECMGRIPYASLIATVLCCVGAGVIGGTLYEALRLTDDSIFMELFEINIEWMNMLRIIIIIVASVMGGIAIILLIFGFLSTGATRKNVYSGNKCIMGGRISAGFFMVLTYIFNLGWVVATSIMVIPVMAFFMLRSICYEEVNNYLKLYGHTDFIPRNDYCFKLAQFGIYRNVTIEGGRNQACNEELKRLCEVVDEAGPLYIVAYCGGVVLILGLVNFMLAIAANMTRLRYSRELNDYRDQIQMDELQR
ncbi:proteolipid protein DM beta-like isoform X2 [Tubulanus polymorphus]|uniref:proteolipid protein DM beta-like isoform X2 n=1 Tax=Tubulanus polymorphus TaxID=672921 RepID=UPI003DA43043